MEAQTYEDGSRGWIHAFTFRRLPVQSFLQILKTLNTAYCERNSTFKFELGDYAYRASWWFCNQQMDAK